MLQCQEESNGKVWSEPFRVWEDKGPSLPTLPSVTVERVLNSCSTAQQHCIRGGFRVGVLGVATPLKQPKIHIVYDSFCDSYLHYHCFTTPKMCHINFDQLVFFFGLKASTGI